MDKSLTNPPLILTLATDGDPAILKRIAELEGELEEGGQALERTIKILRETADALHGQPLPDGWWSWHDLPQIAESHWKAMQGAFHALRSYQYGNASSELAKEAADHLESLLNAPKEHIREVNKLLNSDKTNGQS